MSRGQSYSFTSQKEYFTHGKRARSLFARGSFDSYTLLGSYSPFRRLCFILCMVDGAWLNYDDIKKEQVNLILYDIITDAPGSPGDCVHKTTRETFTPKSPGRPCVHSLHLISQGTSRDHLSPTK